MIRAIFSLFKDSPNSFSGQRVGEEILLLLRRHYFTIIVRLSFYLIGAVIPFLIGKAFLSYLSTYGFSDLFYFLSAIWFMFLWLAIFHTLTIYSLSTVTVTNERIIDSDQHGLFNRKIAELNNNRIQDVSIHVNGIIETVMKFGDVTVQTAASERQFVFHQVPEPDRVKDTITQITLQQARDKQFQDIVE